MNGGNKPLFNSDYLPHKFLRFQAFDSTLGYKWMVHNIKTFCKINQKLADYIASYWHIPMRQQNSASFKGGTGETCKAQDLEMTQHLECSIRWQ